MKNDKTLKQFAKKYLGDENYELALKWYNYVLKTEWDYVVFVVRRAYMLALIMEKITEQAMEQSSDAFFVTDSAFYSRCHKLAGAYIQYHRFPRILLCEDALLHGRNINYFLEQMEEGILNILRTVYNEDFDENIVRERFAQAVTIHVLARTQGRLLLLDRYVMKLRSCAVKDISVMHEFSCRISTLISQSGMVNAAYIFSECISQVKFDECREYGFKETIYHNITEYVHIEPVCVGNTLKAVFTLRVIPSPLKASEYKVVPFVFMPNLGAQETERLWMNLRDKLHVLLPGNGFLEYLDALKGLKGMRTFNEWVTMILSQVLLRDFNEEFDIIPKRNNKKYQEQSKILARNYNVTGFKRTKGYLDAVVRGKYLDKAGLKKLIVDSLDEERKICTIDSDGICNAEKHMIDKLEEYWYQVALQEEKKARLALRKPYHEALDYSRRKVYGCGFTLEELFDESSEDNVEWGLVYFLQMMDAGMIGVSSYSAKYMNVVGFSQFVKAGEMSLLIYPMRMMEYIPLLVVIQHFCQNVSWDWQEEVKKYCRSPYSQMDIGEVEKVSDFVEKLADGLQYPDEWDICYDDRVEYAVADATERENEIRQLGKQMRLALKSKKHLSNFEKYVDEVIWG